MAFDYYDNNVSKEINRRRNNFDGVELEKEPQLWYTAHSLVDMDCHLAREGGSYHGDIQPNTVLLTDFTAQPDVKTIDSTLIHLTKSTYDRMLYNKNIKAAVPPELCS